MKKNTGSSYSQFRKKRPSTRQINHNLATELLEIDQLEKGLEMLSRNRKSISIGDNNSGNGSSSNSYGQMGSSQKQKSEEQYDIPEINVGNYGRESECRQESYNRVKTHHQNMINRQGHARNNSLGYGENGHNENPHQHHSSSPYTDRDGPQSPLLNERNKSSQPPLNSLLSTSNSVQLPQHNPEIQQILLQKIHQLSKKISGKNIPAEYLHELLDKMQEMEVVLDNIEQM